MDNVWRDLQTRHVEKDGFRRSISNDLGVRVLTHHSNAAALEWCVKTLTPFEPNER